MSPLPFVLLKVPIAVVCHLTPAGNGPALGEVRAGSQAGQEPGGGS